MESLRFMAGNDFRLNFLSIYHLFCNHWLLCTQILTISRSPILYRYIVYTAIVLLISNNSGNLQ